MQELPTNQEARGRRTAGLSASLLLVFLGLLPTGGHAETIVGVTIESVSTELITGFNRQANFLGDGSGFEEATGFHTVTPDGFMWLNNGTFTAPNDPNLPGAIVTFNLGDNYSLASVKVWNYNETLPGRADLLNRGANEVEILGASSEGGAFTSLGTFNLAIAPGVANVDFGQVIDLSSIPGAGDVRLVQFNIATSHGGDNNFVGLSEVRFDSAPRGVLLAPSVLSTAASAGTRVGTLGPPPGDPGDTFTYTLLAGEGDTDNAKFQVGGDELQAGGFDFSNSADGALFSVRVRSTGDPSGQEFESNLVITASADSDADDLPDTWEELWAGAGNLSVLSGAGDANFDGDTLTDLEEYELRTQYPNLNPTSGDSDGDTLDDGEEIAGAGLRPTTDPTNADTDGDTLSDGVESNTGIDNGPSDTGSNPTLVDTDGDAFSDADEVLKGSDPSDPNSTPPVTLVGFWPFDADVDPQPDLSGFANDAAAFAGVTWVDDPDRGGVMAFDGNDSYLEAADSVSLSLTGDLTIAAWINVTDFANWRGIVGKSAGPNGNLPASYDLYLVTNDGRARLYTGSPSGFGNVTATTIPALGEWHHLAVTRIGNDVSFYYDGQLDGQGVTTQPMLDSDATLRIGSRTDLVTDFLGRMDDVAIFDGGLSPDQIVAIMDGDFSAFGVSGGGDPLQLKVTRSGAELVFDWKSQAGKRYNLRSVTDPSSADPGDWAIYGDNSEMAATPPTNTLPISLPGDPKRFFVVEEFPAPPVTVLMENFDGEDPGWTTGFDITDPLRNSVWELGDPSNGPFNAPLAANSGLNCYGTNLAGNYGISSNTWLRTPAIDLTTAVGATVTFQQWVDIDNYVDFLGNGDRGILRVLDASDLPGTVTELGVVEAEITGLNFDGWVEFKAELPPAALGQSVALEWRFVSDIDDLFDASGWYIDDVMVTIPGS